MAFIPISQLTQTFSPSGTDVVPVVSNGNTYKISASDIVAGSSVNFGETTFYQPGWYLNIRGQQITTVNQTLNSTYFSLFPVNRNCQIQSISVNVATASVSGTWSAGLYGPNTLSAYGNRNPGSLMVNLGTASTTATGLSTINFNPVTLLANYGGGYNSGMYSIGILTQLSACYLNCQTGYIPYTWLGATNQNITGYVQANDTGGLPSSPYTSLATVTQPPWFWLQYV